MVYGCGGGCHSANVIDVTKASHKNMSSGPSSICKITPVGPQVFSKKFILIALITFEKMRRSWWISMCVFSVQSFYTKCKESLKEEDKVNALSRFFVHCKKCILYSSLCHKRESDPRAEANSNAFPAVHWCACVHAALFQKYPFFALQPNFMYVCHTYKNCCCTQHLLVSTAKNSTDKHIVKGSDLS